MPVDLEASYKWFSLAADAGDREAADKRDQIAASLKPEQLERARTTTRLWESRPLDKANNSVDVPDAWTENKPVITGSVDMKKAVRAIQLILQNKGYDVGEANGTIGEKTRAAITAFQKDHGLKPTGMINRQLAQLLFDRHG